MALQDLSKNPSPSFFGLFGSIFIDDVFRQGRNQNYRELLQLFILSLIFFATICKARESYTRNDGVIIIFGQKLAERDAKVLSHYYYVLKSKNSLVLLGLHAHCLKIS